MGQLSKWARRVGVLSVAMGMVACSDAPRLGSNSAGSETEVDRERDERPAPNNNAPDLMREPSFHDASLPNSGANGDMRVEYNWQNAIAPHVMEDPLVIDISSGEETRGIDASERTCSGKVLYRALPKDRDVIVRYVDDIPMRHALWLDGGRHVRLVGFDFDLEEQGKCAAGSFEGPDGEVNARPWLPGGAAISIQNSGDVFLEGASIMMDDMEASCMALRSVGERNQPRSVVIQNTRCMGTAHSDTQRSGMLWTMDEQPLRRLAMENVTMSATSNGLALESRQDQPGTEHLLLDRYQFQRPLNADGKINADWGVAFRVATRDAELRSVWINGGGEQSDYGMLMHEEWSANGEWVHYGASGMNGVRTHGELHAGVPRLDFAPKEVVGRHYVSPHE